jgi:hypothetical protein
MVDGCRVPFIKALPQFIVGVGFKDPEAQQQLWLGSCCLVEKAALAKQQHLPQQPFGLPMQVCASS